ncbi:MAG: ligand-binding sensor domain-containing protein, partial [Bryobacteraceae bacterium]
MLRSAAVILLMAGSLPLSAQRYNFKFYGEEEGLQNLGVQVVLQDHAGFLWVGTQNGLFRYDGNRFTGFTKNNGLPGSRIESLHESADGTLWVGTRTGLARRIGDAFEPVPMDVASGTVGRQGIASDQQGRLYLATDRGLVTRSRTGAKFELVSSPDEEVSSVYVDGAGTVWYSCGLSLCTLTDGHEVQTGGDQGLPNERWETILGDPGGNLCVRSQHSMY